MLNLPNWAFGAYSDGGPDAHRYFYKHFAGYKKSGTEEITAKDIEAELRTQAPLLANFWQALKIGPLRGETLSRCYANGMPAGAEGGLHSDSNIESHLTAIYYPNLFWQPHFAGETLFFNADATDVTAAVYPKPNRLVVFPGTTPHVARPTSMRCPELRVTLMFKTLGQQVDAAEPAPPS
jgi:SM-20-related protein